MSERNALQICSISVVVPTLNEARNIGRLLRRLPAIVDEVILVDGNSVDGTVEAALAVRPDLRVVAQGRRGKGNALAAGFDAARGRYIVMIDADGSMDPAEIPDFIAALDAGYDYAKGSRFIGKGGSSDISRLRQAGNWALSALTNVLFRTRYSDLCYGYNAFRREFLSELCLEPAHTPGPTRWGDGFEIETMMNIRAARGGARIAEIPSFEHARHHGESNLRTFPDGMRVLRTILSERCDRADRRTRQIPSTAPMPHRSTRADRRRAARTHPPASGLALDQVADPRTPADKAVS